MDEGHVSEGVSPRQVSRSRFQGVRGDYAAGEGLGVRRDPDD
jgi:hypothetical protein